MATKVTGIECAYSSSLLEIPYSEKADVKPGDDVIFKDSEGKEEYGVVKYINKEAADEETVLSSSKILRPATANDMQKVASHELQAEQALGTCKKLVDKLGLDMYVFKASYSFDGSKAHFLFTADERVDFRELVKELAKKLKKQIHLRQIGPRDKAKLIGGYGRCGRALCCYTFLERLESINMDMVRVQGLESKGSSKLSGACGKLLCCLRYEVEEYRKLRENLPEIGSIVKLKRSVPVSVKEGTVIGLDVLNQKVKLQVEGEDNLILDAGKIDKVIKPAKS